MLKTNQLLHTYHWPRTDAGLIETGHQNIVTYLLLQSEIKGQIENPDQYFNTANPNRLQQLDLLVANPGMAVFFMEKIKRYQYQY